MSFTQLYVYNYCLPWLSLLKANDMNEKKRTLKQIELAALDRSVEVKDKQEVIKMSVVISVC